MDTTNSIFYREQNQTAPFAADRPTPQPTSDFTQDMRQATESSSALPRTQRETPDYSASTNAPTTVPAGEPIPPIPGVTPPTPAELGTERLIAQQRLQQISNANAQRAMHPANTADFAPSALIFAEQMVTHLNDAGQLYPTTPNRIIVRRGPAVDGGRPVEGVEGVHRL